LHRLRAIDDEAGVHFNGDLHAVIFGELGVLDPVRRDHFVPLPGEHFQIVRRPGAGDPVGIFRGRRIAGATAEIHHHGDTEFFGQPDGPLAHVLVAFRLQLGGVQRVAVATQRADGDSVVGEKALEILELALVLQHGELAVGAARVVPGT
jgi:hypothetical protein